MGAAGAARGAAVVPPPPPAPGGKPSSKARTVLRKVESLHNSVKPAIVSLSPWFGGYRLEVDNDGDCFGLSWMAAVLIWVAQSKGRISGFVKQLHDAGKTDGAFCRLADISKGHIAYLVWYAERLELSWEDPPITISTAEYGTSLAISVVRTLRGSAESVDGVVPLRLKRALIVAARAFDVFAAPTSMETKNLMTLRTVGESVVFDIGADMVIHGTSSSGGGSATVSVSDSVMRPARGLKLVVGMLVDSIARVENRRRQTREDYTQFFRNIAVGQTLVDGLAVLKGALCHYDIFATAGTSFGNALVREFDLPPISRATNEAALDALEGQRSSQVEMTDEEIKGLLLGKQFKEELDAQEKLWKQIKAQQDKQRASSGQDPG
eukprot:jgi/Undpi1/12172/HiC_scaffold_5.g01848.m1